MLKMMSIRNLEKVYNGTLMSWPVFSRTLEDLDKFDTPDETIRIEDFDLDTDNGTFSVSTAQRQIWGTPHGPELRWSDPRWTVYNIPSGVLNILHAVEAEVDARREYLFA